MFSWESEFCTNLCKVVEFDSFKKKCYIAMVDGSETGMDQV